MSENYEAIREQSQVSEGDRVRVTVEGVVMASAPHASAVHGGVLIRTDQGSYHEIFLAAAFYDASINAVKLIEEPELAPGQTWRGGDARFVVIGNDSEGYVLHHVTTGRGYSPNEFFSRYRNNNELLQEPV